MKTLTLIIATGALLAAGAPTAGAKNSLQCSISAHHSTVVRTANAGAFGYQIQRNLMSAGTSHTVLTQTGCKALQSAKSSPARPGDASQVTRDSL